MDMISMTLDWTTAGEVTIAIIQVITMDITAMEEITYTDIEEEIPLTTIPIIEVIKGVNPVFICKGSSCLELSLICRLRSMRLLRKNQWIPAFW